MRSGAFRPTLTPGCQTGLRSCTRSVLSCNRLDHWTCCLHSRLLQVLSFRLLPGHMYRPSCDAVMIHLTVGVWNDGRNYSMSQFLAGGVGCRRLYGVYSHKKCRTVKQRKKKKGHDEAKLLRSSPNACHVRSLRQRCRKFKRFKTARRKLSPTIAAAVCDSSRQTICQARMPR